MTKLTAVTYKGKQGRKIAGLFWQPGQTIKVSSDVLDRLKGNSSIPEDLFDVGKTENYTPRVKGQAEAKADAKVEAPAVAARGRAGAKADADE